MFREHGYLLVVDPSPASRDVINAQLEEYGYVVTVTDNPEQALALIQSQPYDLILLTLDLPAVDGRHLLESLQNMPVPVPVIMLAADAHIAHIEACLEIGLEDYIAIPISPSILRRRVHSCLERIRLQSDEFTQEERQTLIKLERDFEIGRRLQDGFLPKTLPSLVDWEIAPYYKPARVVGGDVFDVFEINDNGMIGLIVGDVCDKGLPAALFMALFRTFFRAAGEQYYPLGWSSIGEQNRVQMGDKASRSENFQAVSTAVLRSSFRLASDYILRNHGEEGYFITLFFAVLDTHTGVIRYTNGGHLPVFIIGSDGIKTRLPANGPAVGFLPNASFAIGEAQIEPGEIMFAYSDGVTDARDEQRRLFGAQRLAELVAQPADSAHVLMKRVEDTLSTHISTAEQYDDITMLVVRRASEV